MAKDLNNVVEILDLTKVKVEDIHQLLNEGKTLKLAIENGQNASASIAKKYSDYFQANIEVIEYKDNVGICGCGKPANVLVYAYK